MRMGAGVSGGHWTVHFSTTAKEANMFYLIKTSHKQDIPDPSNLQPDRTFVMNSMREVADWCHTFMRALKPRGWRRAQGLGAMKLNVDDSPERFDQIITDIQSYGLDPFMCLWFEKTQEMIHIKIEPADSKTAFEAARLYSSAEPS
jgi:hypothetical protein